MVPRRPVWTRRVLAIPRRLKKSRMGGRTARGIVTTRVEATPADRTLRGVTVSTGDALTRAARWLRRPGAAVHTRVPPSASRRTLPGGRHDGDDPSRGPIPGWSDVERNDAGLLPQPAHVPCLADGWRVRARGSVQPAQGAVLREELRGRPRAQGSRGLRRRAARDRAGQEDRDSLPGRRDPLRLYALLRSGPRGLLHLPGGFGEQQHSDLRGHGIHRRGEGGAGRGADDPAIARNMSVTAAERQPRKAS